MRRIVRGASPVNYTRPDPSLDELSSGDNAPDSATSRPWRVPAVVEQLRIDAYGKCMYCEALMDDVSYGAVEHIKPKSVFPDRAASWDNLGYCCVRCNTNKGSYWSASPHLRLLDPYTENVDEHIQFAGPLIVSRSQSTRAQNTIRKLKFDERYDLLIARAAKIQALNLRLQRWEEEVDAEIKELWAEDIRSAVSERAEFSECLRAYLISRGFVLNSGD